MAEILYDNFTGGTLNTTKWTSIVGSGSIVQNGDLAITGDSVWNNNGVISKKVFARGSVLSVSFRVKFSSGNSASLQLSSSVLSRLSISVTGYAGDVYIGYDGSFSVVSSYSPGVWYTVKFEFDGTSGWKVYINDSLLSTGTTVAASDYYLCFQTYSDTAYYDDVYYAADLNVFTPVPARDGTSVQSVLNTGAILALCSDASGGTYFDSTSKFRRVDLMYYDSSSREKKTIIHQPFIGSTSWSPYAKDGTWSLREIRACDTDGAILRIPRSVIGSDSDIVL